MLGGDVERHPADELGHQVHLQLAGNDLQRLDDVPVAQALRDLTLPQGPRTLLSAVDPDNLDRHLPLASQPPKEPFAGSVHLTCAPHGGEAAPADHLREGVTTLTGGPAADVVRLGHTLGILSATRAVRYHFRAKSLQKRSRGVQRTPQARMLGRWRSCGEVVFRPRAW